jgi:hypothetical protein
MIKRFNLKCHTSLYAGKVPFGSLGGNIKKDDEYEPYEWENNHELTLSLHDYGVSNRLKLPKLSVIKSIYNEFDSFLTSMSKHCDDLLVNT